MPIARRIFEPVLPMLKASAEYIDLPRLGQDPLHVALGRRAELLNRDLPAQMPPHPWK